MGHISISIFLLPLILLQAPSLFADEFCPVAPHTQLYCDGWSFCCGNSTSGLYCCDDCSLRYGGCTLAWVPLLISICLIIAFFILLVIGLLCLCCLWGKWHPDYYAPDNGAVITPPGQTIIIAAQPPPPPYQYGAPPMYEYQGAQVYAQSSSPRGKVTSPNPDQDSIPLTGGLQRRQYDAVNGMNASPPEYAESSS